jgi:cobalamin biosynthesis protein CobT
MDRQGNPVTAHATGSHVNEAITFVPSEPQDQQQINPRLQVIIEQFKAGELTSKSAKLQIAQFSDHLKPNEWAYLNDNTHGSLRDYAVEKLSGIRGSLNSPDIEEDSEEDSEEDDEDSESASENDELATDEETNETDDEDSDEDDESSEEESEEVAEPPTDVNTDQVLDARPLTPEEIAARMSNPTPPPPISRSPKKKLKKHRR